MRGERSAERLEGSGEMKARESDIKYFSRMMVVKNLNSLKTGEEYK